MIDEKKAQYVSEINGQKIYLCSAYCKSQFDQNPSKYGYWVRYFRNSLIRNILSNLLEVPFLSYSFPSNFLCIGSILPAYFCLYPDMHPVQQKNRSKFANLKTYGLAEIGPLQNSQYSFIFSPFLILDLISCCCLRCLLFILLWSSFFITLEFLLPLSWCCSYSGLKIFSSSIMLKSIIGDTDFISPTLTSLVNLALTVGVVMPVYVKSHEMT